MLPSLLSRAGTAITGGEAPLAFDLAEHSVEFLFGISPDKSIEITTGNGRYEVSVADESIVEARIVEGAATDYVTFSPKKVGSTVVTVTDVIGVDYKRVPVKVHETGVAVKLYDTQVDIEADAAILGSIETSVMGSVPFREGPTYIFSNERKGILITTDDEGRITGTGTFNHTDDGSYPLLVLADEAGLRELRIVRDIATGTHSYSSFYGITVPKDGMVNVAGSGGSTRDEQIKRSEVWYREDLTEIYRTEYPGRVDNVTVTYVCYYEFAPFIEPQTDQPED
ncbi:MAG: hypothetical protein LUE10_02425 [Alistipes sp.]|nr:hypothetical protein [Alistipes sp.]